MNIVEAMRKIDSFALIEDELSSALSLYWTTAARILEGGSIRLLDQPEAYLSLEGNFFSAIFLYSYHRAGIPKPRRILYAAVNQCLRGMVTGCDNLLDDEYKKTLETNLPAKSTRFRSVLDIMVSDRVLFEILFRWFQDNGLDARQVLLASKASLSALIRSGAQEASEEGGIPGILPPEQVLRTVHHLKTGLLFQSPWAVPGVLEDLREEIVPTLLDGLYHIGMGCQIMDDMVDLARDVLNKHHNYVASLLFHDPDRGGWNRLQSRLSSDPACETNRNLLLEFPRAREYARKGARRFLEKGLSDLLAGDHKDFLEPAVLFLSQRIGAERMMGTV
jgi:hypothetical protein